MNGLGFRYDKDDPYREPWTTIVDGFAQSNHEEHLRDALAAAFPPAAWPGGYVMVYVDVDGSTLCHACAQAEWKANARRQTGKARIVGPALDGMYITESETDIHCDECGTMLFAADLCPEHGARSMAELDDDSKRMVCLDCCPEANANVKPWDQRPERHACIACRAAYQRKPVDDDGLCDACQDRGAEADREHARQQALIDAALAGVGPFTLGAAQ